MNKILLAGIAAAAFCGAPAHAADMPQPAPVYKAAPAPMFNWTGFYVGADAGYLGARAHLFVPASAAAGIVSTDPNSFAAGVYAGYLYQLTNGFVVGVEGDWGWLDGKHQGQFSNAPPNAEIVKTRWDASARGTLGFAADRSLYYLTGGASWLDASVCGTTTTTCIPGTIVSHAFDGWTLGGGYAYAFTSNLTGRIEYLHADYGTHSLATPGATGGTTTFNAKTDKVRAGLSWKFGT